MHASVKAVWKSFSEPLEGRVHSMYVDVKGYITTGVGNLIDALAPALQLPWRHRGSGDLATAAEVAAAWNALKAQADKYSRLHWKYAAELNDLRLTDADIDALVDRKLLEFEAHLKRHHFAAFDDFPADAQLGILSMAWAVGPGFPSKFPNFARAAVAQEWIAAVASCKIREEGNPGVVPRNRNNERCFANAETVHGRGLDPSVLYWPGEAPVEGEPAPIEPLLTDEDRARIAAQQFDVNAINRADFAEEMAEFPDHERPTKSDRPGQA